MTGRALRSVLAAMIGIATAAAGVGWLYTVRSDRLAGGPRLPEALPLEHLAGQDAQPLLRVALVWLLVGAAAGIALGLVRVRRPGVWAGVAVLLVLGVTGAASDAVQNSERIAPHLAPQIGRGVIWFAAAIAALTAASFARLVAATGEGAAAP